MAGSWTIRHSVLVVLLSGLALSSYVAWQLLVMPGIPMLQQANLLQRPVPLADFELLDHQQQPFNNASLLGRWHLISYGYTYCPDICPLTLAKLSNMQLQLAELPEYAALQLVFYSVDPNRDKPDVLAQYVDFFAGDIVGVVANPQSPVRAVAFEQSLGLRAQIDAAEAANDDYPVNHGVLLYLLNPQAELQAVFTPIRQYNKVPEFDAELLLQDYLSIRRYLASQE